MNEIRWVLLFVDDEINVLNGIKRVLEDYENTWDMHFVTSADEALAFFSTHSCDLIITDLRMPKMDGAALLEKVREKYPKTIRFVLSGNTNEDLILKGIAPADQFLTKPCNPEDLIAAIVSVFDTKDQLFKNILQKELSNMISLPVLPDLHIRLRETLENSNCTIKNVAEIINLDMSMVVKCLQLVNSSYYALNRQIKSVEEAVVYLGMETIKAIVLTTKIFSDFTPEEMSTFRIKELYQHSITTGVLAKYFASQLTRDKKMIEECVMAGMLHDIGKLVLIKNYNEKYRFIVEKQSKSQKPIYLFERKLFGFYHADIGAHLIQTWRLPYHLLESIQFHHEPIRSKDLVFSHLSAVHIANCIAESIQYDNPSYLNEISANYLKRIKVEDDRENWKASAEAALQDQIVDLAL